MIDEKNREYQKSREMNYVLWSIIVILGIMLINLFAQETCQNEFFVNQVSFASTISSIILSVIAIIMTVVSNDSIGSLLHRFRDLHDDIKEVPEELRKTVKNFNSSCDELKTIEKNLIILPEELKDTKIKIKSVSELINELVARLDSIDERTTLVNRTLSELKDGFLSNTHVLDPNQKEVINLSEQDIKFLITNLPYMGKVILYTAIQCSEDGKILDIEILGEQLNAGKNIGYFFGILVMLQLLNLVSFDLLRNNIMRCEIHYINETVKKNIDLIDPFTTDTDQQEIYADSIKHFLEIRKAKEEYTTEN